MIISASRRTDIPAAHAAWLFRRFDEGFVLVRNPMNPRQVQRINLSPEAVDGIVFWTKNPIPMLDHLHRLSRYPYYFQYTLTAYGCDAEAALPSHEARLDVFLRLAEMLGPNRVLWRYDPILLSDRYPADFHFDAFGRFARRLRGATDQVTISFVDAYSRNRKRLDQLGSRSISESEMRTIASQLSSIAAENGMRTVACSEAIDLTSCGVAPAKCVDAELFSRISGVPLRMEKDKNQRKTCGCAPSVDIGAYNTCPNGCLYCYANYSPALLQYNLSNQDDASPLLCSHLNETDRITERKMPSLRETQLTMNFEGGQA